MDNTALLGYVEAASDSLLDHFSNLPSTSLLSSFSFPFTLKSLFQLPSTTPILSLSFPPAFFPCLSSVQFPSSFPSSFPASFHYTHPFFLLSSCLFSLSSFCPVPFFLPFIFSSFLPLHPSFLPPSFLPPFFLPPFPLSFSIAVPFSVSSTCLPPSTSHLFLYLSFPHLNLAGLTSLVSLNCLLPPTRLFPPTLSFHVF